jgi:DNA-binding CsgD family transcriptional regulator
MYHAIFEDGDPAKARTYLWRPSPFGHPDVFAFCKAEIDRMKGEDPGRSALFEAYELLAAAQQAAGLREEAFRSDEIADSLKNFYYASSYLFIKEASEQEYRLKLQEKDYELAAKAGEMRFQQEVLRREQRIGSITLASSAIFALLAFAILALWLRARSYARKLAATNQRLDQQNQDLAAQKAEIEGQNQIIRNQQSQIREQLDQKERELASRLMLMQQYQGRFHNIRKAAQGIVGLAEKEVAAGLQEILGELRESDLDEVGWEPFKLQFEQVHPNFFAALLHLHPDLTPTDLKHCALIRLGLSNKEKAQILNLSYKGIDSANYRIKKKLGLGMDDNLANYLMHVGAAEARS